MTNLFTKRRNTGCCNHKPTLCWQCAMFYRCECGEQHTWETDNDFCSYGEGIDT